MMNDQPYSIPLTGLTIEEEIKKSRFITHLAHTPGVDSAKSFIESVKKQHVSARHNCWAFVAGRPEDSMKWGCSDDGEPSGTAGKPMLAQLSGSNLGEVTVVISRYFGGVKLGTGGLVRAYGGGVQQALKQVQIIEKKITVQRQLRLDYPLMPLVQSILDLYQARQIKANYTSEVILVVEIDRRDDKAFKTQLINQCAAKIDIIDQ